MPNSLLQLGLPIGADHELDRLAKRPMRRFLVLSQRLTWGITQSDLIRVDLDRTLDQLLYEYRGFFPAHITEMFVRRAQGRDAEARAALDRAHDLHLEGSPFSYLLPSEDDFACTVPKQRLHTVMDGMMWRVATYFPLQSCPWLRYTSGTLVRTGDGGLVFLDPICLDEDVAKQIDELGPVTHLVTQGKGHSRFVEGISARYPKATNIGVAGHAAHPPSAGIRFDALLDGHKRLLPDEFRQVALDGNELDDVILFHEPSATLFVHDLMGFNLPDDPDRTFLGRYYNFVFGLHARIGIMGYQLMLWNNLGRLQQALRKMQSWRYRQVCGAHWPIELTSGSEMQGFVDAVSWWLDLPKTTHAWMLLRYFRRQPGFLIDLLRYLRDKRRSHHC